MILWLTLFLLVVAIAFVLAFQSMGDYPKINQWSEQEYSLFLIRNPSSFNSQLLDSIHQSIVAQNQIISIERLFKGNKSALVIFGPKGTLQNYTNLLNLLELEDYAKEESSKIYAWESGVKDSLRGASNVQKIFADLPQFLDLEQFWWQVVLQPEKKSKDKIKLFKSQIRQAVMSQEEKRREELARSIQSLLPHARQRNINLSDYKQRFLDKGTNSRITSGQIIQLFQI